MHNFFIFIFYFHLKMDLQKFIQKPIYNLEEKFTNLGLYGQ